MNSTPRVFELLRTAPHELSGWGVVWPDGTVTTWTEEHGAQTSENEHVHYVEPPEEHRRRYLSIEAAVTSPRNT